MCIQRPQDLARISFNPIKLHQIIIHLAPCRFCCSFICYRLIFAFFAQNYYFTTTASELLKFSISLTVTSIHRNKLTLIELCKYLRIIYANGNLFALAYPLVFLEKSFQQKTFNFMRINFQKRLIRLVSPDAYLTQFNCQSNRKGIVFTKTKLFVCNQKVQIDTRFPVVDCTLAGPNWVPTQI